MDRAITIREISQEDAESFIAFSHQLDRETTFMLLTPGERKTSAEEQRAIIDGFQRSPNQAMLIAEAESTMIGFTVVVGGTFTRNRHCASLVIGVLKTWWGKGVGGSLLDAVQAWAKATRIHRLELSVHADNKRAVGLYERKGFTIEGRKRDSLIVDGSYRDEFCMAKLI